MTETIAHTEAPFGPWIGVPKERQNICAVVDCPATGVFAGYCPADRGSHHHGCIHYQDMTTALKFREGSWGLLCAQHLRELEGR